MKPDDDLFWDDIDDNDEDDATTIQLGLVDEAIDDGKAADSLLEELNVCFRDWLAKDTETVDTLRGHQAHPDEGLAAKASQNRKKYVKPPNIGRYNDCY
jgi:hypothetical protein